MDHEEEQQQPLLGVQEPPSNFWKRISRNSNLKVMIPTVIATLLLAAYFVVYYLYLPSKIQQAIDGNGSDIRHVHLSEIHPIKINISVRIPLDEPTPVPVQVQIGTMSVVSIEPNNTLQKRIPIAKFQFPTLSVPPLVSHVWLNDTLEIHDLDSSWISWYTKQMIKYGIRSTHIQLSAVPRISIPILMGTWPANLHNEFYLDQNSSMKFDPKIFDFATSDVAVDKKTNDKGQNYFNVSFKAYFTNSFAFTMSDMKVQLKATILYEGVPIVHVYTSPKDSISLKSGRNSLQLHLLTVADYTAQLMNMIGRVAAGDAVDVVISGLEILGDWRWMWVQDILDGLMIPFTIPPIEDDLLK